MNKLKTQPLLAFYKIVYIFVPQMIVIFVLQINYIFQLERNFTNNNTPSMPLYDAHLEGFFF